MVSIPFRAQYSTNSGALGGGSGRRRHAVGLSLKIWIARAPICLERRAAFMRPCCTPRWRPTGGASAGHVRRRRGSRRASVVAMEFRLPDGRVDALSVSLVAFFVSLIVLVAALLLVPALL